MSLRSLTGLLGLGFVVMLAATPALALTTYQYVGQAFDSILDSSAPPGTYTTSMRVTGSFTVLDPLAPSQGFTDISALVQQASLFDGRQTFDWSSTPAMGRQLYVETDASGQITQWSFYLLTPSPLDFGVQFSRIATFRGVVHTLPVVSDTTEIDGIFGSSDFGDSASVTDDPGTWSIVPEPGTALLTGLGLSLIASRRREPREAPMVCP